jgi:hypothetical protein
VERLPGYANYQVFAHALRDGGFIDDVTLAMLRDFYDETFGMEWIRSLGRGGEPMSVEFVYVTCEMDRSLERFRMRARETADERRLQGIWRRYESWLGGADVWMDDRTGVMYEVREVRNDGIEAVLRTEAESLMNAEMARVRLERDELIPHDNDVFQAEMH